MNVLRIGTRGSALALAQVDLTEAALARVLPDLRAERRFSSRVAIRSSTSICSRAARREGRGCSRASLRMRSWMAGLMSQFTA